MRQSKSSVGETVARVSRRFPAVVPCILAVVPCILAVVPCILAVVPCILAVVLGVPHGYGDEPQQADAEFRNQVIRGKVVWLADGLKSQFGISTVPEAAESGLGILTDQGRLFPIVENLRGRAFRKDERLRGKRMEILARRHDKQPLIQILRVYEIDSGDRFEIDYWCDVCAIVMYEKGPCACCQDDNRLRRRPVEPNHPSPVGSAGSKSDLGESDAPESDGSAGNGKAAGPSVP